MDAEMAAVSIALSYISPLEGAPLMGSSRFNSLLWKLGLSDVDRHSKMSGSATQKCILKPFTCVIDGVPYHTSNPI